MNKALILLVISLLAVGGVLASGSDSGNGSGSRSGEDDSADSDELVCCESFGYGAMMVKTESTFEMISRSDCVVPEGFVGGGKNIVDDDYCEIESDESVERIRAADESETRAEIRARTNISRPEDDDENETEDENEIDDDDKNETDDDGYHRYVNREGERIKIRSENGSRLGDDETEAESEFELEVEDTEDGVRVHANLSNGRNAIIKIMPSTASETALARLRLKVCVPGNCTIQLKEVGKGNETVPAYEVEIETEGKAFGLFKTKVKVKTQVNAETGEVIKVKKAWWKKVKVED